METQENAFALQTMKVRIPNIVKAVYSNNDYLSESEKKLLVELETALRNDQQIKIYEEVENAWNVKLSKLDRNNTWLTAPWFLAESYCFYLMYKYCW